LIYDILSRPFRELGIEELEVDCALLGEPQPGDVEATIALRIDDRYELDVTSPVQDCLDAWTGAGSSIVVAGAAVGWRCDGKGRLVWDLAARRLSACEFGARIELDCRIDFPTSSDVGKASRNTLRIQSKCDVEWSMVAAERAEPDPFQATDARR
jgi:hypothetical protein